MATSPSEIQILQLLKSCLARFNSGSAVVWLINVVEIPPVEGNVIWADVTDPTSRDFEELAEEFGFHHLSIEDCQNPHQRPKVEEYSGYYFIVLYEAELVGPNDRLEQETKKG